VKSEREPPTIMGTRLQPNIVQKKKTRVQQRNQASDGEEKKGKKRPRIGQGDGPRKPCTRHFRGSKPPEGVGKMRGLGWLIKKTACRKIEKKGHRKGTSARLVKTRN